MKKLTQSVLFLLAVSLFSVAGFAAKKVESAPLTSVELAFKKEYAFLLAQKRSLLERQQHLVKSEGSELKELDDELAKLEAELVYWNGQVDRRATSLQDLEKDQESQEERQGLVETTTEQAKSTLANLGVVAGKEESISALFGKGVEAIAALGSVSRSKKKFFLEDGRLVDGEVIQIGQVASFGSFEKIQGPLVPVGDGQLKVAKASKQAKALFADKKPRALKFFLYENLDKPYEERQGKTVMSVLESGGVIGGVIVFLGLVALVLVGARFLLLRAASSFDEGKFKLVSEALRKGDIEQARQKMSVATGAIERIISGTIANVTKPREEIEDAVSENILSETTVVDRFGSMILVFAAVAPLLGLLGTVTGMISTFDIITEFGTGDPKLLSGGISEALVTTELGLIVAIPSLLLGHLLSGWSNRIKGEMEHRALQTWNAYAEFIASERTSGEKSVYAGN